MKLKFLYNLKLKPRTPFNFYLTSSCYNFEWWFDGSKCLVPISRDPPLIVVAQQHEDLVSADVYGNEEARSLDVERKVKWIFGLDEDLTDFYNVVGDDPILYEVPRSLLGMRLRTTDLWNALLIAICQQNASFIQGWSMLCRIYKYFGSRVELDGLRTIMPPGPIDLLEKDRLEETKVGYRAKTIMEAALAFTNFNSGFFDRVEGLKDEDAEALLREIKGVGSYTARLTLILSQRRYSLLPLDRWLKSLAEKVYGLRDVEGGLKIKWRGWCGLAAFFVTVVLDAEVITKALQRALGGDVKPRGESKKPTPLTLWMHSIC